jgi:UDP-glucose-4-epimerase GalE
MILVTGGAGYIGSHFVHRVIKSDTTEKILVLDNLVEGHEASVNSFDRVTMIKGDIGDADLLNELFKKHDIEAVVHFAAYAYVGESHSHPFKYFQNNVTNSLTLFEAMEQHNVRKIVFSSSCATYGEPLYTPIDERHPQKPINTYGMTKLMVEQILGRLAETSGWSQVSLRYFNAAGAETETGIGESHNPETHLIPLVLKAMKGERQGIEIFGTDYETRDGTCIRDYIHVNDLADAHISALSLLRQKEKLAESVNLGTTTGSSVLEIIARCEQISGRKVNVKRSARRPGDPPELVANAAKAKEVLNWQTRYTIDDIIESAWQWEQKKSY